MDDSHEMNATCIRCGYVFELTSSTDQVGARPESDDLSLCISCGALAAFVVSGPDITLRPLTESERTDALSDPDVQRVLMGWLLHSTEHS